MDETMENVFFQLFSRQITLFSNKLVFTTTDNSKPKDSNLIYLGDINDMESNFKNPTMLVLVLLVRKLIQFMEFLK